MGALKRTLSISATIVAILVAPSMSFADPIFADPIEGELTEGDLLAEDSVGTFYYELFDIVSLGTDSITITLSSLDFAPYLAWGFDLDLPPWPSGSNAPYGLFEGAFCSDDPGSDSLTIANPAEGQAIQIMVATCYYNPTPLGSFTLTVDGDVSSVPEPGSLLLFGIGLVGLAFGRRKFKHVNL